MNYGKTYLEITVHNNDYNPILETVGKMLVEMINQMDYNENDLLAVDEYVYQYILDTVMNLKLFDFAVRAGTNNRTFELAGTVNYIKNNFSLKFVKDGDIKPDMNQTHLYIQLSDEDNNKGYMFFTWQRLKILL